MSKILSVHPALKPFELVQTQNQNRSFNALLGVPSCVRFCQQEFGEFPRLVGRYCSYLLPKQAGGTPQILVDKTSRMTGRLRVYCNWNQFKLVIKVITQLLTLWLTWHCLIFSRKSSSLSFWPAASLSAGSLTSSRLHEMLNRDELCRRSCNKFMLELELARGSPQNMLPMNRIHTILYESESTQLSPWLRLIPHHFCMHQPFWCATAPCTWACWSAWAGARCSSRCCPWRSRRGRRRRREEPGRRTTHRSANINGDWK